MKRTAYERHVLFLSLSHDFLYMRADGVNGSSVVGYNTGVRICELMARLGWQVGGLNPEEMPLAEISLVCPPAPCLRLTRRDPVSAGDGPGGAFIAEALDEKGRSLGRACHVYLCNSGTRRQLGQLIGDNPCDVLHVVFKPAQP